MAWLTAGELSALRDHFDDTLPATCEIDYVTESQDARGALKKTWAARGTAIPCRFAPQVGRDFDYFSADKVGEEQFWTLSVAQSQTITITDRVILDGKTYQVRQVNDAESDLLLKRALLVTQP